MRLGEEGEIILENAEEVEYAFRGAKVGDDEALMDHIVGQTAALYRELYPGLAREVSAGDRVELAIQAHVFPFMLFPVTEFLNGMGMGLRLREHIRNTPAPYNRVAYTGLRNVLSRGEAVLPLRPDYSSRVVNGLYNYLGFLNEHPVRSSRVIYDRDAIRQLVVGMLQGVGESA